MNVTIAVFCVIATVSAVGCAPTYRTTDQVKAASTVERDNYKGTTWVRAPLVHYNTATINDVMNQCCLRSLRLESGGASHQLYVIYRSTRDWAFLDRAYDKDGNQLTLMVIDRDVNSRAVIAEHVAVELDDDYLRNAAEHDGLDIKIAGTRGETVVRIPPHYIQGFLAKLDEQ